MKTSQLTINAMLAAVCAVLGYFALDFFSLKITLESFPVLLAALMYGPVSGMAVGGIGTFLYQLLRYGLEASTPLWVAPYLAGGLVAGLYAKRSGFNNSKKEIFRISMITELVIFACNTVSLYLYSKIIFGEFRMSFVLGALLPRLLIALAKGAVFGGITRPVLVRLSPITKNGR